MARSLNEVIAVLPPEEQRQIDARYQELEKESKASVNYVSLRERLKRTSPRP